MKILIQSMVLIACVSLLTNKIKAQPNYPEDFQIKYSFTMSEEHYYLTDDPSEIPMLDKIRMSNSFQIMDVVRYKLPDNQLTSIVYRSAFTETEGSGITPPTWIMIDPDATFTYNAQGELIQQEEHTEDYLDLKENTNSLFANLPVINNERIQELQEAGLTVLYENDQLTIQAPAFKLFIDYDQAFTLMQRFDENQSLLYEELNFYETLTGGELVRKLHQERTPKKLENGSCVEEILTRYYSNHVVDYGRKSKTQSISTIEEDIQLFPNPAQDWIQLQIHTSIKENAKQIQLIASDGKTIKSWNPNQWDNQPINIEPLAPGHYFFLIKGNNFQYTKALIKL